MAWFAAEREIQCKACVPDCSGYVATGVYDRTAGQRDPDVKACVHIPSCAAGFGPGEECSYDARVLGICAYVFTCRDTSDGSVWKDEKKQNGRASMYLHSTRCSISLWPDSIFQAGISRVYVRDDHVRIL